MGWFPNLDIENGCFTKHPFINGCLGFQEELLSKRHISYCTWKNPRLAPGFCPGESLPQLLQAALRMRRKQVINPWPSWSKAAGFGGLLIYHMGVSRNRGVSPKKWMVYNGKPIKMDDLGVPLFLETPICLDGYPVPESIWIPLWIPNNLFQLLKVHLSFTFLEKNGFKLALFFQAASFCGGGRWWNTWMANQLRP